MSIADLPRAGDVPAVTAGTMAEIDRIAIVELGVPELALMENAAAAVARVSREILGDVPRRRVVALAGVGNNGGDAFAAARRLAGWGADVLVVASDPARMRGAALVQRDACERAGVDVSAWSPDAADPFAGADLVLDGLLGYSARGAPREPLHEMIRRADRAGVPIVAIDVPSGLDPDAGVPLGVAIRAAVTVTLGLPKSGLVVDRARPLVGELVLADIGLPARAFRAVDYDAARVFGSGDLVVLV